MKLNPYLKDFWKVKKKIKVLRGGRASSKTEDTAGVLIHLASKYKVKVACVRKFQANIKQSVYSVLKKKIDNDSYFKPFFNFTDKNITSTTGSEFIFLGWERNTDQIKGLDDIDIMWIEEGHTLNKEQWQIIKDTILLRKDTAMVIIVFNPDLDTDFSYTEFVLKSHPDVISKEINYINNPFLPKTALELIEKEKLIMDDDDFNHTYLGFPKAENEDAFIKRKWIEAAIDANKKLGIETRGIDVVGYDIADSGGDTCAICHVKGNETIYLEEWKAKEDELEESAKKTFDYSLRNGAIINYDCIGVGASAGSTFKRLNNEYPADVEYYKFDAGDKVQNPDDEYQPQRKNKDHFENLKAQSWQDVADRFLHTYNAIVKNKPFDEDKIISISSSCDLIDKLKRELSSPKKDRSRRGLVKVESKDDLKKRGIDSPNIADSFVMGYYKQDVSVSFADIDMSQLLTEEY
jgi:phage terminase large subunit